MTDELLKELITEVKGLRTDLKKNNVDTCTPDEALIILGLNNRRYLPYFINQELLTRRKGGKSFMYYKSECTALADKIRQKSVIVPPVRQLQLYNE